MMRRRLVLLVALLCGPSAARADVPSLAGGASASFWPCVGRDPAHSSRGMFAGPASDDVAWSVRIGRRLRGGAIVGADGTLFVASGRQLVAVGADGAERWRYVAKKRLVATPAFALDGLVIVGDKAGDLIAVGSGTGVVRFTVDLHRAVTTAPVVVDDGTIYVGVRKGVVAVRSGAVVWHQAVRGALAAPPAVAADGTVYLSSSTGGVHAVSPAGELLWRKDRVGRRLTSAVVRDDRLYVGAGSRAVVALARADGRELWRARTAGPVKAAPALGIGRLVVVGAGRHVQALTDRGDSASELWNVRLARPVRGGVAVGNADTVFVGADDGDLRALAGVDGGVVWQHGLGAPLRGPLALGPGDRLYAGDDRGRLHAVGLFRPGADCWRALAVEGALPSIEDSILRTQMLVSACAGPEASPCRTFAHGEVNGQRIAAARRLVQREVSPERYLAVARDRTRKLNAALADEARACRLASDDGDHDLVPDDLDRCPDTPALTPTSDDGCPDDALPPVADPAAVYDFLDRAGLMANAACNDAPAPQPPGPAGIFFALSQPAVGKLLRAYPPTNQPAGCPLWYEFQVLYAPPGGAAQWYYLVLPGTRGVRFDKGFVQFIVAPTEPGANGAFGAATNPTATSGGVVAYRVRATNGDGAQSTWSVFTRPALADCQIVECVLYIFPAASGLL